MSELELETPTTATLPSTPPTLEEDDIDEPPEIIRQASSIDPGAFAAYGKRLKHCQDKSCQHGECNQDVQDTEQTSQQYPGINVVTPTKPIISSMDARKRTGGKSIGDTNKTVYSSRPTPYSMQLPPDPAKESEQFKTFVCLVICRCGIHVHTFTCKKPPKGWLGCRLCYDKALSNGTRPIELRGTMQPDGTTNWEEVDSRKTSVDEIQPDGSIITVEQEYVEPYDPEVHTSKENLYPLPSGSSRTVVWELDRPMLEPLPELDDDMTKEQIISKLYNEMLPSTSAGKEIQFEEGIEQVLKSRVDLHHFNEHDKNNLFYGLLLGLMDSSQLKAGKKSVEELRSELMECLIKLPLDCKLGDKTVKEHIESRMKDHVHEQDDTSIEEMVKIYSQLMMNVKGDDCFEGGALEVNLLAQVSDVNVAVYDEKDDMLNRVEYIVAKTDDRPTIHFLRTPTKVQRRSGPHHLNPPEYYYKLFTPKLNSIMNTLEGFGVLDLKKLYGLVSKSLVGRNGKVVDFNSVLTSVLGCNSNLLLLGSQAQSKAALFYIGPYINKDGVKITDALPILKKAHEDAMKYPSIADDADTNKRRVQHTLTRAVNKMNCLVEVSDTQAASHQLGMGASLCSEDFGICDTKAYKNFVDDEIQRTKSVHAVDNLTGEDSDSEEEDECYVGDELGDDGVINSHLEEEENDNNDDDFRYINAYHGTTSFYKMDDGSKLPVSFAALYRYRGKALKSLTRYEYTALVRVVETSSAETSDTRCGRKKSRTYPFGAGLGIENTYHQVLRSKLLTPKFTSSPPSPPKKMPQLPILDESDEESDEGYNDQLKAYKRELADWRKKWRKKADKFAHFYLTVFRPEDELYEKGQVCTYKYDYEAFLKYYNQLCWGRCEIDDLRVRQIDRVVHSLRVDKDKREMLAAHRGRAKTMWSPEEKEAAKEYYGTYQSTANDFGIDVIPDAIQSLTSQEETNARKHLGHSRAILDTLRNLTKTTEDSILHTSRKSSPSATKTNVNVLPFNMDLDESKRQSKIKDTSYVDEDTSGPNKYRTIPDLDKKVEDYIKAQDLSADKDIVVKLARDHFEAIRSGKAREKDYIAPNALVCGKPGNGKSKIIESLDGIAKIMKVGEQMKHAFMGSAAVGIRGTTLLKSWNIPVFEKGQQVRYKQWKDDEKRALKRMFGQNIDSICAVIIDEVSTIQPYMLAYLSIRMQELFENDKPFGGRMVILLGDFDQKPPTAGGKSGTLPGVVMKYIEEEGAPPTSKSAEMLGLAQMGGFLFTKFRYIELTTQHRSGDPKHMALINKMSKTGVGPTVQDLKSTYKKLSREDMESDDFRFATNIVTGNAERRDINAWQAKRWAVHYGVNPVRWPRKREESSWKGRPTNPRDIEHAMHNSCFWEYYIPGAMGYLNTYSINSISGLTNGTEIKYHSLSFEDKEQRKQFKLQCAQATPGDIITIHSPPTAINVELFPDFAWDSTSDAAKKKRERKEWLDGGKGSITADGRVVIPISLRDGSKIKSKATYIPGYTRLDDGEDSQHYYFNSQLNMKDYFPIEPAFSITVDKAQVCVCVFVWYFYAFF